MSNYEYVDKFYEMDPNTEDLLFDGTYLENDMIVLVGEAQFREDAQGDMTPEKAEYLKLRNRWCMVSHLVIGRESVAFLATYNDGTKRKMLCDVRWPWLVKISSIRQQELSPVQEQEFDAFGGKHHDPLTVSGSYPVPLHTEGAPTAVFQMRQGEVGPEETPQSTPDDPDWLNDLKRS